MKRGSDFERFLPEHLRVYAEVHFALQAALDPGAKSGERMMAATLLAFEGRFPGRAAPAVDTLAGESGMGERTAQKHLAALEKKGTLARTPHDGRTTGYVVTFPQKPVVVPEPTPADLAALLGLQVGAEKTADDLRGVVHASTDLIGEIKANAAAAFSSDSGKRDEPGRAGEGDPRAAERAALDAEIRASIRREIALAFAEMGLEVPKEIAAYVPANANHVPAPAPTGHVEPAAAPRPEPKPAGEGEVDRRPPPASAPELAPTAEAESKSPKPRRDRVPPAAPRPELKRCKPVVVSRELESALYALPGGKRAAAMIGRRVEPEFHPWVVGRILTYARKLDAQGKRLDSAEAFGCLVIRDDLPDHRSRVQESRAAKDHDDGFDPDTMRGPKPWGEPPPDIDTRVNARPQPPPAKTKDEFAPTRPFVPRNPGLDAAACYRKFVTNFSPELADAIA